MENSKDAMQGAHTPTPPFIPPRTQTAPGNVLGSAGSHTSMPPEGPPSMAGSKAVAALPGAPPAVIPPFKARTGPHPSNPGEAPGTEQQPPSSPPERTSPTPREATADSGVEARRTLAPWIMSLEDWKVVVSKPSQDGEPYSFVHHPAEMMRLRHVTQPLPKRIFDYAMSMWNSTDDITERPSHMCDREGIFGNRAAPVRRIVGVRKLHNEVLGVLSRVNTSNLELMRQEMMALPIRQSDPKDIEDMMDVFFAKSIQPEDAIYAENYVILMRHVIRSMAGTEVGTYLQKALLKMCQKTFEYGKSEFRGETADGSSEDASLDPEARERRRLVFANKQKSNIHFLTLLFKYKLVQAKLVKSVMHDLLYGREEERRGRRIPADYEILHFLEMMRHCGQLLLERDPESPKRLAGFYCTMVLLQDTHPEKRIHYLILNMLEEIQANWNFNVVVEDAKQGIFYYCYGRQTNAPGSPASLQPTRALGTTIGTSLCRQAMETYFNSDDPKDLEKILPSLDEASRITMLKDFLDVCINTVRRKPLRELFGARLTKLVEEHWLRPEDIETACLRHMEGAVCENHPFYFECVTDVIKSGLNLFTLDLCTKLLAIMVRECMLPKDICEAMRQLVESIGSSLESFLMARRGMLINNVNDNLSQSGSILCRFRALPVLLHYQPPVNFEAHLEADGFIGSEENWDILRVVNAHIRMLDIDYYVSLVNNTGKRRSNDANKLVNEVLNGTLSKKAQALGRDECLAAASAIFAYYRFCIEERREEILAFWKKITKGYNPLLLCIEFFETWLALDQIPKCAFEDIMKIIKPSLRERDGEASIEKLKHLLEIHYPEVDLRNL